MPGVLIFGIALTTCSVTFLVYNHKDNPIPSILMSSSQVSSFRILSRLRIPRSNSLVMEAASARVIF